MVSALLRACDSHCTIQLFVLYQIKISIFIVANHNVLLLVPSIHATCFGRTDHLQALNRWYLKLKIKCMNIYVQGEA
jgi:hypothetical protein